MPHGGFNAFKFRLDENRQLRQNVKTSRRQNEHDRNIKLSNLILSTLLLSKTDIIFKRFTH